MAGRFLIQKFSRVSRSAGALATGPASEGGVRAPINLFNGATAHPRSMVPSNREIHNYEGGIKTISDLFHRDGAAVHPGIMVPSNHMIRGYVAMCLKTCPCSRAAAKTNCTTDVMAVLTEGLREDVKSMRRLTWMWGFTIVATVVGVVCGELRPSKQAGTSRCASCGRD